MDYRQRMNEANRAYQEEIKRIQDEMRTEQQRLRGQFIPPSQTAQQGNAPDNGGVPINMQILAELGKITGLLSRVFPVEAGKQTEEVKKESEPSNKVKPEKQK